MREPAVPAWLTARPIAHRGLHCKEIGVIENSLSAALSAVERGFAIECDVQISRDGEAIVFHDESLERLTAESGPLKALDAAQLTQIQLKGSADRLIRLSEFLAAIAGRVPLICEIKSLFDDNMALADRVKAIADSYQGPLALKSFDPAIISHLRRQSFGLPLGIIAEARYDAAHWPAASEQTRQSMRHFLHWSETDPDFLSYCVDDLPNAAPQIIRQGLHRPIMTWTVRTPKQRVIAGQWADQIVFEHFIADL